MPVRALLSRSTVLYDFKLVRKGLNCPAVTFFTKNVSYPGLELRPNVRYANITSCTNFNLIHLLVIKARNLVNLPGRIKRLRLLSFGPLGK